MQFKIDEESRDALTIIMDDELFRYKRLGEGIASNPAECQDILKDIEYKEIYIDNIYVTGRTDQEHIENLEKIFRKLDEAGLRVNLGKCDFFKR